MPIVHAVCYDVTTQEQGAGRSEPCLMLISILTTLNRHDPDSTPNLKSSWLDSTKLNQIQLAEVICAFEPLRLCVKPYLHGSGYNETHPAV